MSSNAALVELKTPQQLLLGPRYRGKSDAHPIYPPHIELAGAVAQVQDQAYRLQKRIDAIVGDNEGLILKTFRVDCVVVAGVRPQESAERQAFELYRQGLKDVRIVTFDELLQKLKSLRELLAQSPAPERFDADLEALVDSAVDEDVWDDYADEDGDEEEPSAVRRRRRRM